MIAGTPLHFSLHFHGRWVGGVEGGGSEIIPADLSVVPVSPRHPISCHLPLTARSAQRESGTISRVSQELGGGQGRQTKEQDNKTQGRGGEAPWETTGKMGECVKSRRRASARLLRGDGEEGAALTVGECKTLNNSLADIRGTRSFDTNRCALVFNG